MDEILNMSRCKSKLLSTAPNSLLTAETKMRGFTMAEPREKFQDKPKARNDTQARAGPATR